MCRDFARSPLLLVNVDILGSEVILPEITIFSFGISRSSIVFVISESKGI
jgi:hypothetical protein